ncbi:transcriptional regulator with XRE-family HTH domain [Streptomyces sp. TLI_235]|nr:transcriptional regulator with XRE-family HTH domain [Streptomyces sp. TLI_235]
MARTRVNVDALYAALDAERDARTLSWRQLAGEVGISPSTLTRLRNGNRPDVDAFAALVRWLGSPAEVFMVEEDGRTAAPAAEPALVAQLAPLLRARSDLAEEDVRYLEDLIGAAVRRFNVEREARTR